MRSTHRQHDPDAARLLADLEQIESAPWPAALADYAAALLALGQRCERTDGMAEFHRWSASHLQGLLNGRSPQWREWRADALADVTATIAGALWAFRASLHAGRRPNLLSMVRAAVIWRANDIAESLHHRHQRQRGPARAMEHAMSPAASSATRRGPWAEVEHATSADDVITVRRRPSTAAEHAITAAPRHGALATVEHGTAPADAFTVALAREVCARLAAGGAPERALLLIGQGESIAGAARRTGASRQ